MRRVVGEVRNLRICEEESPAPAALGRLPASNPPLPITLWTSGGYFIRAFATEPEARAFALQDEAFDRPMAFQLDTGDELFVRGFAAEGDSATVEAQAEAATTCWICTRDGAEIDEVDGLAFAVTALRAQQAHSAASITGPHPVLPEGKPR